MEGQSTAMQNPAQLEAFELRILDAASMTLRRVGGVSRLTIEGDRSWSKAAPARAFPVSDPDHYIGFLDGAGKDIGMLHDPRLLDEESQRVLDEDLEMRYFVPVVTKIHTVKEEFGSVYWTVDTTRGSKEIICRNLRDNLQELSPVRVMITDVDGNRFEFPDLGTIDGRSLGIILRNL